MMYFALGSVVTFGLIAVAMAIRGAGLKVAAAKAEIAAEHAIKELEAVAENFKDYKTRSQKQIADLMLELDALEDQEGEAIATIKNPVERRARRRNRVLRLLSEEDGEGGSTENNNGVSGDPATDSAEVEP